MKKYTIPRCRVILDFADGIYTEDEVKRMEVKIVNTLKYDLTVPTTNKFLGLLPSRCVVVGV